MAAFSQYRFQLSNTLLLISFPRNFQHHPQAYPWTSTPKLPRFGGKFLDTFWSVEILHRLRTGECESPFIQLGFNKSQHIISSPATIKRTSIFFQPKNDHQKKHLKKRWPASNNAIVRIYSSNFWGIKSCALRPFFSENKKKHTTRPPNLGIPDLKHHQSRSIWPHNCLGKFFGTGVWYPSKVRKSFFLLEKNSVEIGDVVIIWSSFSSWTSWIKMVKEKHPRKNNICFLKTICLGFYNAGWISKPIYVSWVVVFSSSSVTRECCYVISRLLG